MALGTLKNIRSMVRSRIGEPIQKEFLDTELNLYIHFGQLDVARRLLRINQEWFMTSYQYKGSTPITDFDLPEDCLRLVNVFRQGLPVAKIDVEDIGVLYTNANYTPSQISPFYYQVGSTITILPAVAPWQVKIFYVKKPTELTTDDSVTIIPDQFLDLIISYVVMRCKPKLKDPDMVLSEKQYDELYLEIEKKERADVGTKLPGEAMQK